MRSLLPSPLHSLQSDWRVGWEDREDTECLPTLGKLLLPPKSIGKDSSHPDFVLCRSVSPAEEPIWTSVIKRYRLVARSSAIVIRLVINCPCRSVEANDAGRGGP